MSVEMAAVVFDGSSTAEKELSSLRLSRLDPWLTEVAVLERHETGRFSMKATSPDYGDEGHVGAGIAIGGGTGVLIGLIGGPLGLLFWGAMGAIAGGVIGDTGSAGPFDPLVEQVKDALSPGCSALILVAEHATAQELVTAAGADARQVIRRDLTDEQVKLLTQAAVRA
jgi:uncharacterized membrane protein